jgi:hypothetical protein
MFLTVAFVLLFAAGSALADPPYTETQIDPGAFSLTVTPSMDGIYYRYDWDVTFNHCTLLDSPEYMDVFAVYDEDATLHDSGADPGWEPRNGGANPVGSWGADPNTNRIPEGGSIGVWGSFDQPLTDPIDLTVIHVKGQTNDATPGGANSLWVRHGDKGPVTPELPCLPLLATSAMTLFGLIRRRRTA